MRRIIGILFLCLYAFSVMRPVLPYAEYQLNKAYIADQLCENKDKEEMNCEGKCYLKKRISQEVQAEQQQDSAEPVAPKIELEELSLYLFTQSTLELLANSDTQSFDYYYLGMSSSFLPIMDSPPPRFS